MLWGDGTPTREFLYVDDCVEGLVLAAERYDGADPVNLGTGEEISIGDLAELVARPTGFAGEIAGTPRSRTASRAADSTLRAPRSCSASARGAAREGLARTVAWYRGEPRGVSTALAPAARRPSGRSLRLGAARPRCTRTSAVALAAIVASRSSRPSRSSPRSPTTAG